MANIIEKNCVCACEDEPAHVMANKNIHFFCGGHRMETPVKQRLLLWKAVGG